MASLTGRLGGLSPAEVAEYRHWTDAYEAARADAPDGAPAPEDFLPPDGPLAVLVLVQNLKVELEARLDRGEPIRPDDLTARHPRLRDDPEALAEVLAWGSHLADLAPGPATAEFSLTGLVGRHPHLRAALVARRAALYREQGGGFPPELVPPGAVLLQELAPGGMGRLALIWVEAVGREEVLKLIDPLVRHDAEAVERFRREIRLAGAQVGARVVPVFQSGTIEGHLYYTMPFLRGGSLRDRLDAGRVPLREGVAVLADLARSVHRLHTQDPPAVHRDLKPANILFRGPELAEPWIADLGLAKLLVEAADATLTAKDGFLGTPGYMAPEQVFGNSRRVGPAADVHALGAILYELLTGRPPFREETPLAAALRTVEEDPLPPRRLAVAGIPAALDTVALKALAKDPADRYASAAALADDLGRWLDGRPILARPPTARDRLRSLVRRNPYSSAFGALAVASLIVGTATSTTLYLRERAEKQRADRTALRLAVRLGEAAERIGAQNSNPFSNSPIPLTSQQEAQLRDVVAELAAVVRENAGIGSLELGTALNRRTLALNLLGDNPGALDDAQHAVAVFAALPPTYEARVGLATALVQSGRLLAALGRPQEGRPRTGRAVTLLRDLVAGRPDDTATRFLLARAEVNLGNFAMLRDRPDEAIGQYRRALDHLAILRRQAPDNPQYLEWEARTRSNLGLIFKEQKRAEAAVEAQTEAVGLAERLVAAHPESVRLLDCLAACRNNLGEALVAAGRLAEAEAAFRRALEPYQTLADRFPDETEPVWGTAMVRTSLADVLGRLGRWADAVPLLREAGATFEPLLVRLPDNPDLIQNARQQRDLLSQARRHLGP